MPGNRCMAQSHGSVASATKAHWKHKRTVGTAIQRIEGKNLVFQYLPSCVSLAKIVKALLSVHFLILWFFSRAREFGHEMLQRIIFLCLLYRRLHMLLSHLERHVTLLWRTGFHLRKHDAWLAFFKWLEIFTNIFRKVTSTFCYESNESWVTCGIKQ